MPKAKTCLISGASRGLGYAIAKEAARRKAHVIAVGRNQGALDELADEIDQIGGAITIVPMDLTDDNAIAYLASNIQERWGQLNYWFHTAWFTAPMQPTSQLLGKDLDTAYKTNIRMTARMIGAFEPLLRQTPNAHAVFFDDLKNHGPHMSNIGMSKTAQMEIVRAWAEECKRIGPEVRIEKPAPMFGNIRSTLYPGEEKSKLSTPAKEAERIVDITMSI